MSDVTVEERRELLEQASQATPQNVLCTDGKATVALFSHGGGRAARAAKALRPLNAAARRAASPRVTFDRSVLCYVPRRTNSPSPQPPVFSIIAT